MRDAGRDVFEEHAETRAVIDRLRALPPEGVEPDWAAMERSIREAVGTEVPRPWWRRWTALLPATTLVTALGVLLLVMWGRGPQVVDAPLAVPPARDLPATRDVAHEDPRENVVTLWLDGAELEIDAAAPAARALVGEAGLEEEPAENDVLLPAGDLAWVDGLDDAALDRAEHWLDRKPEIPVRKKG
ncbi:MAG TPA: hypothetical protein VGC42_11985 [Kofleriaceae bacterium]